jgi:hypothetical protein
MTTRQIQKALPFWKGLLRLEDWVVQVDNAPAQVMVCTDGTDAWGLTTWSAEDMRAQVHLRRGAGEEVLVHELLHLVYEGDQDGPRDYDILFERALNRTAGALVQLRGRVRG